MESVKLTILILFSTLTYIISQNEKPKDPTVLITVLVRNKAHTLPYFFSYLENLHYPKDRISLWIRSDNNQDNSNEVIETWLNVSSSEYHSVNVRLEESQPTRRDASLFEWTDERYLHLIKLKEEALAHAKKMLADYIFILDADVFLTDRMSLKKLIQLELPILAPLLTSQSLYANFWGGMRENYYYRRTEEYMHITKHKKVGEFKVPLVNSAVLIDLNHENSKYLTHDKRTLIDHRVNSSETYTGPLDDTIVLAMSAHYSDIPVYISNSHRYGFVMAPMEAEGTLEEDQAQMLNVKVMMIRTHKRIPMNGLFEKFLPKVKRTRLGLSRVFVISLNRRRERFDHIKEMTDALGLEVERFPATDGDALSTEYLFDEGYRVLKSYSSAEEQRPMRMGEVGCLLSHHRVWEQVVDLGLDEVLVLEDDVAFEHYFKFMAESALSEARSLLPSYDLIYFARHLPKNSEDGPKVVGSKVLREAGFSTGARAYVLTFAGAKKLLQAKPLKKMVPVDELLAIMYDKHPNEELKKHFPRRDLKAYAVEPQIVHSLHEKGHRQWHSDVENSREIEDIESIYSDVIVKDEL